MHRVAALLLSLPLAITPSALAAAAKDLPLGVAAHPRVAEALEVWRVWAEYQAAMEGVPGVSYGFVYDQELIGSGGFGWADPEARTPATPETLYSICSISKLFTSIAVLQLRDAGKLRLDDPIAQHLPQFDLRDAHPNDGAITVRGLLTHSAGLPRESDYPYWTAEGYPFPTRDEVWQKLDEQETLYPASTYFQYSNLGLTLAGEIVSGLSEQSYDSYVHQNILDPLGMADTYTEIPKQPSRFQMAQGHSARKRDGSRERLPLFQVRGIAPAAGFASNVPDLARFASWQFRALADATDVVLAGSTLREMQRVQWMDPDWKTTRGLGFGISHKGTRTFVGHGGGCPGYITRFHLEPKVKLAAIVLGNAIGSPSGTLASKALDLLGPAVEAATSTTDETAEPDDSLDRYVGVYVSDWGESAIVRWKGGLAILPLGASKPEKALTRLEAAGEHAFRRIRENDEGLGETITFEIGPDGQAMRFGRHSSWSERAKP